MISFWEANAELGKECLESRDSRARTMNNGLCWVSTLAYPNLLGIKGFVDVDVDFMGNDEFFYMEL